MSGYCNRMLEIDLSSNLINVQELPESVLKKYVGGATLAAWLFLQKKGYEFEPLAPESPLYFFTGPLVGTAFPGSSRFVMCARSPLTGIWGESASGGGFGAHLKRAGYDGIYVTGRAAKPCYISILDDQVMIEDAGHLWGTDTYETIDLLKAAHAEGPKVRTLAIGPAGENRVRFACVCNDKAHYFGRTGMGAVMGSKLLKALVVRGSGKVRPTNETAYKEALKDTLEAIDNSMIKDSFHDLGTAAAMDLGLFTGDVPIKNWSEGEGEEFGPMLGGPAMEETILRGRGSCLSCPIGCKPVVEVTEPGFEVPLGPGPEYETCASFGTMVMNPNLKAVAKANDLCNRLGLDTITCGATVAFIMDAYEHGKFTRDEMDGLDLSWGNAEAVIALLPRIAYLQGFGARAALGSHALAAGLDSETQSLLVTVKKLELPMHDPRGFHGQGLAYMNSNRGACHLQHSVQSVEQGMVSWPELGLEEDYPAQQSDGKAAMVYLCENIGQMGNALCVCHFVHWAMGNENLLRGLNALTGFDFSLEDLLKAGERSWLLKRALNNLMGITGADDRLPQKVLTPLAEGGAAGSIPDEQMMKAEYYVLRGLDVNGFPQRSSLANLGLDDVEQKLYQ
jgi:aldehyde:ferredoxin oxidoreductase